MKRDELFAYLLSCDLSELKGSESKLVERLIANLNWGLDSVSNPSYFINLAKFCANNESQTIKIFNEASEAQKAEEEEYNGRSWLDEEPRVFGYKYYVDATS